MKALGAPRRTKVKLSEEKVSRWTSPFREEDLPAMRLVQGLAMRDLAQREGHVCSTMALDDKLTAPLRYLLRWQPALWWLAEREGQLAGFSQGFVRAELWFLSNLFVHPQAQTGGVGERERLLHPAAGACLRQ